MSTVELPRDGVEPGTPPAPRELNELLARLKLRRRPEAVRVEVEDGRPSRLPVRVRVDAPAHGHGPLVANRPSVNRGHRPRGDHRTVRAEVRLV